MTNPRKRDPKHPTTVSGAVGIYRDALENAGSADLSAVLLPLSISQFITPANMVTFLHLLANTTLLTQAKLPNENLECRMESAVHDLYESDWFIPLSLSLLELRFFNQTVSHISEKEKVAVTTFYKIPAIDDQVSLTYYRSGTTSLIFISRGAAVKLIRPIYLIDEEISSLNRYSKVYLNAPDAPTIHWSTPYAMAMDWIRGKTIDEILISDIDEMAQSEKLAFISSVSRLIFKIHKDGFSHGDINPRNIIVQDWGDGGLRLVPIDYGFNYSLTKPVISSQAYLDSARYIAPSPASGPRDAVEDDIYSTSVLVLDCWFGKTNKSPFELVHRMAIEQPLLASIIEYGLASDGDVRGGNVNSRAGPDGHKSLDFFRSIRVACSKPAQKRNSANNTSLLSLFLTNPIEIWKTERSSWDGDEDQYSLSIQDTKNRKLTFYRGICVTATTIFISLIGLSASESLEGGGGWFAGLRNSWSDAGVSLTPRSAGFWTLLPGYAICLSFMLVATKYYLSIFSSASPTGGSKKMASSTASEFAMRLNSFAYIGPVSYCFLLDPRAWPFCAAIGLLIVAANNFLTKRFLTAVRGDLNFVRLPISQSSDVDSAFLVFSGWGTLVTSLALSIAIAGVVIITSGPAQNSVIDSLFGGAPDYNIYEYLIASCVIMINYVKMQKENCGKLAATIRTMILRHIEASFVLSKLSER